MAASRRVIDAMHKFLVTGAQPSNLGWTEVEQAKRRLRQSALA
jgi:hypothetical protein